MTKTAPFVRPPALSGFCNPSFLFGIGNTSHDDSHARCAKDDCPCPHHLDPNWRFPKAQREAAARLSEQLGMEVRLDERMPEGTFLVGSFEHGARTFPCYVEEVEPPRMRQVPATDEDREANRVRFEVTETLRLRVGRPEDL